MVLPHSTLNRHSHVHARASCSTFHPQGHPRNARREWRGLPCRIPDHGLPPSSEAMGSWDPERHRPSSTFTQRHRVSCRTYHLPQPPWCSSPAADTSTTQLRRMALSRWKVVGRGYVLGGVTFASSLFLLRPLRRAAFRLAIFLFSGSIGTARRSLLCARDDVLDSLDGIPPSFSTCFRKGKLSQIFPSAFRLRLCPDTGKWCFLTFSVYAVPVRFTYFFRKTVPPFFLPPAFHADSTASAEDSTHPVPLVPYTARSSVLSWSTSCCRGKSDCARRLRSGDL